MERSAELTSGNRWAIFGLVVLYFIGSYVVGALLMLLVGALSAHVQFAAIYSAINAAVQALETMISTVGVAAIYFELRRVKEGIGIDELASVFD